MLFCSGSPMISAYCGVDTLSRPERCFSARRSESFPLQHTRSYPAHGGFSMTNRLAASIFILLMSITTARAADNIVGPLRTQWGITRDLVVNLVQIMPEEKYDYRPTPDIRSFREIVAHLILEKHSFMNLVAGEPPPDKAKIDALKSRDELTKALAESYAFGERTLAALPDAQAVEQIP